MKNNKSKSWRQAGWLPMTVTSIAGAILFTIGIMYNNSTLKAKRAAEQAVIDAKNGVVRADKEFRMSGDRSAIAENGSIKMSVKSVKESKSILEITVDTENKLKGNMDNLTFSLIDVTKNGNEITAVEKPQDLGGIPTDTLKADEKAVHFNYNIGENLEFLFVCRYNIEGSSENRSIAVPFHLR